MLRIRAPGFVLALLLCGAARAQEPLTIALIIKDHAFSPAELHVPAGKPIIIAIDNQDATAEEFDSTDLQIEKVIAGGRKGVVHLRALQPGRYSFIGEYHAETAQGVVVAE